MRAVLIATGQRKELLPLVSHRPSPLFRIADKAIIVHIVEFLSRQGYRSFDIVLHHLPELVEEELGNGQRWGVRITYHLTKRAEHPYAPLLAASKNWKEETVLVGYGDVLPNLQLSTMKRMDDSILYYSDAEGWTGWGLLSKGSLQHLARDIKVSQLPTSLPHRRQVVSDHMLFSACTFEALKRSNDALIGHAQPSGLFPSTARMVEPGIWISRAAVLHPSARLIAPVFVGESCQIQQDVVLGPNAVVENNCLIDNSSLVQDSIICERSYIGEKLEIRHSIVDQTNVINLNLRTRISVPDPLILSELVPPRPLRVAARICERISAALVVTLTVPLWLIFILLWKLQRTKVVKLPSSYDTTLWTTFDWITFGPKAPKFLRVLPALYNVVCGDAYVVGVMPRTTEELQALPMDWKELVLRSKVGMITLAQLNAHGQMPTADDLFAAEAFYIAHQGYRYDLKILLRSFLKLFKVG